MTPPTAWAHLPNAAHIDAVLADVKARPEVWKAALDAACDAVLDVACVAAYDAARGEAWDAARGEAWDAAWDAVWDAACDAVLDVAWDAAWYAILALIAWDSAADLLDLPADALRVLVDVAAPPVCHQAALLLPWAVVREAT